MNQNQDTVPPPLQPDETKCPEDKRLWIGNLDPRINDLLVSHGATPLSRTRPKRKRPLPEQHCTINLSAVDD
ncbi:hypothetical protein CBL_06718 [Carabus blaptoides fortunei]